MNDPNPEPRKRDFVSSGLMVVMLIITAVSVAALAVSMQRVRPGTPVYDNFDLQALISSEASKHGLNCQGSSGGGSGSGGHSRQFRRTELTGSEANLKLFCRQLRTALASELGKRGSAGFGESISGNDFSFDVVTGQTTTSFEVFFGQIMEPRDPSKTPDHRMDVIISLHEHH